jgi:hypothetical protein
VCAVSHLGYLRPAGSNPVSEGRDSAARGTSRLRPTASTIPKLSSESFTGTCSTSRGFAEAGSNLSWYGKHSPDRFAPEVVVVVHSVAHREAVRVALRRWIAKVERVLRVRVVTLPDTGGVLAGLITGVNAARSNKHFTVSERSAVRIRDGISTLFRIVNDDRDAIGRHNQAVAGDRISMPPLPTKAIDEFRELIRHDLFGEPRSDVRWSSRQWDGRRNSSASHSAQDRHGARQRARGLQARRVGGGAASAGYATSRRGTSRGRPSPLQLDVVFRMC